MKRFLRIPFSLAAAAMLSIGCGASDEDTQPEVELGDEELISADINALKGSEAVEWWRVRNSLRKYRDVNAATADGYIPVSPCEALPGEGGMGVHYLHPGFAGDLTSDPYKPEILLYLPDGKGGLEFLGPEYFQADAGQARPSVINKSFDGPMPGHSPDMPVHYDLHVWLFKYNPKGLFSIWNPRVKCPAP